MAQADSLGREEAESEALRDPLWADACQQKYSGKKEWQKGDLVMWQNRMVLHRRDALDPNLRRVMHRTQLKGRSPITALGFQSLPV